MAGRVAVRLSFVCLLLFAGREALALDPTITISQYGKRAWRVEDGLPESAVQAIAQTRDGYIWLGTQEGLARFDGLHFTTFSRMNTPAFSLDFISSLAADAAGGLWIGTQGSGLVHEVDGRFLTDRTLEALGARSIFGMASAPDGSLWLATSIGIVRRAANGTAKTFRLDPSMPDATPRAIAAGRAGGIWVGTADGMAELRAGSFHRVGTKGAFNIRVLSEDHSGRVLIGTDRGLFRLENGRVQPLEGSGDLATAFIGAIHEDSRHNIWIGSNKGVQRISADGVATFTPAEGLVGNMVLAIFEDREETLWIGTASGLNQLRDTTFKPFGLAQGLRNDMVMSIVQDDDGAMWIGTTDGLGHLRNGVLRWLTVHDGLSNASIFSLTKARQGGIWAGTMGGGICHVSDNVTACYGDREGLSSNQVDSAVEDDSGLWIGTLGGGLDYLRDGKVSVFGKSSGLPSMRILSLQRARAGGVWVGLGDGGLVRFADGRVRQVISLEGVSEPFSVRGVVEDADGTLWIAADDLGFFRWRHGRSTRFPLSEIKFNSTWTIVDDGDGYLWITSNQGIARFSRRELEAYAGGKTASINPEAFGAGSGMPSVECNGVSLRASDGSLWFGTTRGLAITVPGRLGRPKLSRASVIESFTGDGKPVPLRDGVLPAGTNRAAFEFTVPEFISPEQVRFRYKLEGFDADWVTAQGGRTAVYTNLPPGRFAFHVMASDSAGRWREDRMATVSFRRAAAFHETSSFRIVCIVLIFAAAGSAFLIRLRMVHKREQLLARRVDEQTAALREANLQLVAAKESAELVAEINGQLSRNSRTILNSVEEGIFGLDAHGAATFVNHAAAQTLGWSVKELTGERLHRIIHSASDGPLVSEESCEVCSREPQPAPGRVGSATFRKRNGDLLPIEYTANSMLSDDGTSTRVVVAFRDVTERRAVERLKSEFVSTVSHELRTPLTSIRGALGLLASGLLSSTTDKGQRMLNIAVANTDRLVRLINDILDLERIDSGKIELVRRPESALELMTRAAEGLQSTADQAGLRIVVESSGAIVWIDSDRIMQTLVNLLSNAIKFSPRGSLITLGGSAGEEGFTFRVADRGRGVPGDKLEAIFQRFHQVDASDSRDKGGTGLGLAICRSIVNAHGGRIWAEPNPEGGTVFQLTIPSAPAMQKANAPRGREREATIA